MMHKFCFTLILFSVSRAVELWNNNFNDLSSVTYAGDVTKINDPTGFICPGGIVWPACFNIKDASSIWITSAISTLSYHHIQLSLSMTTSGMGSNEYCKIYYSVDDSFNWIQLNHYNPTFEAPITTDEFPTNANNNSLGIRIKIENNATDPANCYVSDATINAILITSNPTITPTLTPTISPTLTTLTPSNNPTQEPTFYPTIYPTQYPTNPTYIPTINPSIIPTFNPTVIPSNIPTFQPTFHPLNPTFNPTNKPTIRPTVMPTQSTPAPVSYEMSTTAMSKKNDINKFWDNITIAIFIVLIGLILCCLCFCFAYYVKKRRKQKHNENVLRIGSESQNVETKHMESIELGKTVETHNIIEKVNMDDEELYVKTPTTITPMTNGNDNLKDIDSSDDEEMYIQQHTLNNEVNTPQENTLSSKVMISNGSNNDIEAMYDNNDVETNGNNNDDIEEMYDNKPKSTEGDLNSM